MTFADWPTTVLAKERCASAVFALVRTRRTPTMSSTSVWTTDSWMRSAPVTPNAWSRLASATPRLVSAVVERIMSWARIEHASKVSINDDDDLIQKCCCFWCAIYAPLQQRLRMSKLIIWITHFSGESFVWQLPRDDAVQVRAQFILRHTKRSRTRRLLPMSFWIPQCK